jgi:hypothetical protein
MYGKTNSTGAEVADRYIRVFLKWIKKWIFILYSILVASSNVSVPQTNIRLYCDICEQFDLHDTEDCPTQASSNTDSHHGVQRGEVRPYCESCEGKKMNEFLNIN